MVYKDFEVNEVGSLRLLRLERDFYRELSNQRLKVIKRLKEEIKRSIKEVGN